MYINGFIVFEKKKVLEILEIVCFNNFLMMNFFRGFGF